MILLLSTHYFIDIHKNIKLSKLVFKEYDDDYIITLTSKNLLLL